MGTSSRILWLDTVESTNSALAAQVFSLDNLSVIAARFQTAGRGQGDHRWHSRAGENLTFSAALIADRGLDDRVAIATDNFHEYRGQFFARRAGLTPCSLGCASYPLLGPGYWAREVVGVLAAWIRGY